MVPKHPSRILRRFLWEGESECDGHLSWGDDGNRFLGVGDRLGDRFFEVGGQSLDVKGVC